MKEIISEVITQNEDNSGYCVKKEKFVFDDNKHDHKIVFPHGVEYQQSSPMAFYEADWNNDGDFYEVFGASFVCTKGLSGIKSISNTEGNKEFWSLNELVDLIRDGAIIEGVLRKAVN